MLPHHGRLNNDAPRRRFHRCRWGRPWRGLSRRALWLYCARPVRRGGRVAEGARLESVYTGNRIVGSNPTPSASVFRSVPDTWVTVYTGDIGNTFGPKGLSSGSSLHVS